MDEIPPTQVPNVEIPLQKPFYYSPYIFGLIILIVGIGLGFGIYVGKTMSTRLTTKKHVVRPTATPTPTPEPTPINRPADPIVNGIFRRYSRTGLGLEFLYPKSWVVMEEGARDDSVAYVSLHDNKSKIDLQIIRNSWSWLPTCGKNTYIDKYKIDNYEGVIKLLFTGKACKERGENGVANWNNYAEGELYITVDSGTKSGDSWVIHLQFTGKKESDLMSLVKQLKQILGSIKFLPVHPYLKSLNLLECDSPNVKSGEEFSANDLHLVTKNNLTIPYATCDRIGAEDRTLYLHYSSTFANYYNSNPYNGARTSTKWDYITMEVLSKQANEDRFDKNYTKRGGKESLNEQLGFLGYLYKNPENISSNPSFFTNPEVICDHGMNDGSECPMCQSKSCIADMGCHVYLHSTKYLPLNSDAYVGFSIYTKPVIQPTDQRLMDLLYNKVTKIGPTEGNMCQAIYGLKPSELTSTFNKDFAARVWEGKSPIRMVEDFLDSISIDPSYL